MTEDFREIKPYQIKDNVFKLIEQDWMLVTAGKPESFNTMTASWGGFGSLWSRLVCFAFIRPQRYTHRFMENADFFTLSFFEEQYRDVLTLCGTKSGRNVDKVAKTGLTPVFNDHNAVYFLEARIVLLCRKIYAQDIAGAHFIDISVEQEIYPAKDYHRMYVGEIVHCFVK